LNKGFKNINKKTRWEQPRKKKEAGIDVEQGKKVLTPAFNSVKRGTKQSDLRTKRTAGTKKLSLQGIRKKNQELELSKNSRGPGNLAA